MINMDVKPDDEELMHIKIDKNLMNKIRTKAWRIYGPKRGYLTKAVTDVMTEWVG
jgi:hypothetical protein